MTRIDRFSTGSECSYTENAIVYETEAQRDQMIAAYAAECTREELSNLDGDDDVHTHTASNPEPVADLDDWTGLVRSDGSAIKFRDLLSEGPGVTTLDAGANG